MAFGRLELEAITATGAPRQFARRFRHGGAEALGLVMEGFDGGSVGSRKMHSEQGRLRPLAQRHDMVLGTIGSQMDRVPLRGDWIETPDKTVKGRGPLQMRYAEFDAAQSNDF